MLRNGVRNLLWMIVLVSACKKDDDRASPPPPSAANLGSATAPAPGGPSVPAPAPVPAGGSGSGSAADPVPTGGSGAATNERQLAAFDGVELVGSIDVAVTVGGAQRVQIDGTADLVPLVTTELKGHTLVVSTKPEFHGGNVVVRIAMPAIVMARLGGSGNVHLEGVQADALALDLSGSGNLDARGTAHHLTVTVTGSGQLGAKALTADDADVRATGSGNIEVAATKSLAATLTGSGSIRYVGNPPKVTKQLTGSGSIEAGS